MTQHTTEIDIQSTERNRDIDFRSNGLCTTKLLKRPVKGRYTLSQL